MPETTDQFTAVELEGAKTAAPAIEAPKTEAKPAAKAEAKDEPKGDDKSSEPAAKTETKPDTFKIGEEEFEVDERGMITMPVKAFEKRLKRMTRAELRNAFGSDDLEAIKTAYKEHGELKAKAEEERRKRLDEHTRVKEDLDAERQARKALEQKIAEIETEHVVEQVGSMVASQAAQLIDDEFSDFAIHKFRTYVRDELSDAEADAMTEKDVRKWFKEFADKHPRMSREAPKAAPAAKTEAKPLSTGANPAKPVQPPSGSSMGAKTIKPGQPNSMSPSELREWKRQHGYV